MKKMKMLSLFLVLILCVPFIVSCGNSDTTTEAETTTQSAASEERKEVTIDQWLNANGNLGLWTMTVTLKSVESAESAIVTDASGKEVHLSPVYRDKASVNFTTLDAKAGDVLVIRDGKYNKSGDTIAIKEAQLVESRPTTRTEVGAAYDLTGHETLMVNGQTFEDDLVVTGTNGRIIFVGCTFRGTVTLIGGENAKVVMLEDCTFAETSKCIILSSVVEATISTSLPKFMIFCTMPEVICVNSGAAVAYCSQNVVFNGTTYANADSTKYIDEAIGEDTIVPYTGQTADMHNVSVWTEKGEEAYLQVAIKTETN